MKRRHIFLIIGIAWGIGIGCLLWYLFFDNTNKQFEKIKSEFEDYKEYTHMPFSVIHLEPGLYYSEDIANVINSYMQNEYLTGIMIGRLQANKVNDTIFISLKQDRPIRKNSMTTYPSPTKNIKLSHTWDSLIEAESAKRILQSNGSSWGSLIEAMPKCDSISYFINPETNDTCIVMHNPK
jgi:hypothetical protein